MTTIFKTISLSLLITVMAFTSCKKDDVQNDSETKKALISRTWQMQTVTTYTSGVPFVSYQRGAADNEEDFSLVQQTYKSNGSIHWVDQFGDTGTDGTYQLLQNDTKIKIGYAAMGLSIVGENLQVNASKYSYTLLHGDGDSTRFEFSPL